jgi:hypothetical protein
MRWPAIVAVLVACGGTAEPPIEDSAQDGTRLHLRWWELDGARVVNDDDPNGPFFRDTLLDTDCRIVNWNTGRSSCAPVNLGSGYADIMYADAGCTQPLAPIRPGACITPAYAIEYDDVGATQIVSILGPSTATQYYDLTNGDCIGPLQIAGTPYEFHETGAPIVDADLVAVAGGSARGTGRIQRVYLESDDGFRFPFALWDTELEETCRVYAVGDELRCTIPVNVWGRAFYFADATCTTTPLFDGTHAQQRYWASQASLTADTTYYEVGEEVVPDPLYGGYDEASCAVRDPMGQRFYAAHVIEMARLTRAPASGPGRIVPNVLSGEGSRLADGLHDTLLDVDCTIRGMADGTFRCLPGVGGLRTFYADNTCTTTVEVYEHILQTGDPPRYLGRGAGNGCTGGISEIYELGTVRLGAVFDRATPTLCVPHQAPGGEIVPAEYYLPGAPVALDMFAVATRS